MLICDQKRRVRAQGGRRCGSQCKEMGEPEGSGFELCSSKRGPSLAASTTWDLVRMWIDKTH